MEIHDWENDGGAVEHVVCIELDYRDAVHLMNRADLKYNKRDSRILDAFRRALLNGYGISSS